MNVIMIRLMALWRDDPPRCPVCHGTKVVRKLWKRNSQWVFVDAPCPQCQARPRE